MKKQILKMILPIFAFVVAITTAFAFKKADDSTEALYIGHRKVGLNCVSTDVVCTDINTGVICRDSSSNTLYKFISPTFCPDQLWKPML